MAVQGYSSPHSGRLICTVCLFREVVKLYVQSLNQVSFTKVRVQRASFAQSVAIAKPYQ